VSRDLFQLQTDLINAKVTMAANTAIDRVVEQIRDLRNEMHFEMHNLRGEMNKRFSSLENRMIAVETKLGIVNERQREVRAKLIDYLFKAGWLALGMAISSGIMYLQGVMR
jgi:hypothetical protein